MNLGRDVAGLLNRRCDFDTSICAHARALFGPHDRYAKLYAVTRRDMVEVTVASELVRLEMEARQWSLS